MDDDDYWNTSETKAKALNFDDDVLSPQEILAIGQKSYSGQAEDGVLANTISVKTTLLPITSLVSSKVLELILLAQSGKDPKKETTSESQDTVAVTLKRLTLGRSCSLHLHRSMKSKSDLLDGAVAIGDGNVILTVVLFLIATLNKKLVYELLSSRPVALNHYISFLHSESKITELTDLLTMLGRSPEAAMYQYQHAVKSQASVDAAIRKLTNLMGTHFSQPAADAHQAKLLADYVKLLEWQKLANKPELNNKSALYCLAYACAHHWTEGAGNMMSPLTLCQRQQITPLQYDWVVLNVHAKSNKWDIVESLFTKKDWLGRTTVSSHIPTETLIYRLNELKASKRLLATCVNKIASADERLRLAHAYKIHSVVIEIYAKQKDRLALTNYKMTLNPQSEEYILAENTLRDLRNRGTVAMLVAALPANPDAPEWQKLANKPELNNKSALYCLAYACAHHWTEGAGNMMSPLTLCQRQQITPLQYDWVVLNVHAKSNKWDIVESLFTKKDWLGRTTVSSHIPTETLIYRLNELKASKRLLATCVNKIASADERLRLAHAYKIHSVVIEIYAKQKDRLALTNYKMTLNPQSEEYILAENTLRDLSIKWKN